MCNDREGSVCCRVCTAETVALFTLAEFTVYTDHKLLKSLFTKEMANTKIQRWAVLLAEGIWC